MNIHQKNIYQTGLFHFQSSIVQQKITTSSSSSQVNEVAVASIQRMSTPPPTLVQESSITTPITQASANNTADFTPGTIDKVTQRIKEVIVKEDGSPAKKKRREEQVLHFYKASSSSSSSSSIEQTNNIMHHAPIGRRKVAAAYVNARTIMGSPIEKNSPLFPATRIVDLHHITTQTDNEGFHWFSPSDTLANTIQNVVKSSSGVFAGTWGSTDKLSTFFPTNISNIDELISMMHDSDPIPGAVSGQRILCRYNQDPNILLELIVDKDLPNHLLTGFPILANVDLIQNKTDRSVLLYTRNDSTEEVKMTTSSMLTLAKASIDNYASQINTLESQITQKQTEILSFDTCIAAGQAKARLSFQEAEDLVKQTNQNSQIDLVKLQKEQFKKPTISGLKELLDRKKQEDYAVTNLRTNKKNAESTLSSIKNEKIALELRNPIRYDLGDALIVDIAPALDNALKGVYVTCSKQQIKTGSLEDLAVTEKLAQVTI